MPVVQVHAPTTDAEQEKVDECYGQIQSEINRAFKQDMLLMFEKGMPTLKMAWRKILLDFMAQETEIKQDSNLSVSATPMTSSSPSLETSKILRQSKFINIDVTRPNIQKANALCYCY